MGRPVAIIGGTIWGNRGAEAMLETLIGEIRCDANETEFVVYSYYPRQDARLVSDAAISIESAKPSTLVLSLFPAALWAWLWSCIGIRWPDGLLPAATRKLRSSSILLDIAGISFSDGREKFLPFNILTLLPAMLMGVPVGKCSQALGPFDGWLNRLAAKFMLRRCAFVFARGAESRKHLDDLGGVSVSEAPDLAFAHRPGYALSRENTERADDLAAKLDCRAPEAPRLVCVNPSSLVAGESAGRGIDAVAILARLVGDLTGRGCRVLLAPTASRESAPASARNNDIPMVRKIAEACKETAAPDSVFAVDWDLNFASLKDFMARADAVVTLRFHGLVAALSLGVPVMTVGWGHKYEELMAAFGLQDWSLDFSEMPDQPLSDIVLAMIDDGQRAGNDTTANLDETRRLGAVQVETIRRYVN
ncbi:MAG: polysaccharide pyruvyl transferase family protein [Rhodospirillales bacterium]|nr:polysaccharide pyruvyl transferase family protein [Rhodospirillales bacterium]